MEQCIDAVPTSWSTCLLSTEALHIMPAELGHSASTRLWSCPSDCRDRRLLGPQSVLRAYLRQHIVVPTDHHVARLPISSGAQPTKRPSGRAYVRGWNLR